MLKKIFSVLCMAVIFLAANSQVSAEGTPKVVVIFDAPTGTFSEPEKAYNLVETSLANIMGKYMEYELVPASETEGYVQIYREEHDMITSTDAEEGRAIEVYLKKDDLDEICKYFGGDYIIYTRVTSTAPQISVGIFSASQKINVVLDFRVWSNAKKDFSYMKRVTSRGSSTAIYAGLGSASRALEKGLRKSLQEIEKDATKIRTAMTE